MTKILLNSVLGLCAFLLVTQARATITFEDVSASNVTSSAPITSGGYTFNYSSTLYPGGVHAVTNIPNLGASNGTNYLVYESGVGTETFTSGTGAFNLNSLDLGGWVNFYPTASNTLEITGTRIDNTTVTYYALIAPTTFNTYELNNFTNLRSVTLGNIAGGAYIAVDNIQVSPVPEPQNYSMLLAGLTLLAAITRKRKPLQER
jgi:hypothetical protein